MIRQPKAFTKWIEWSRDISSVEVPHIAYKHPSGATVISDVVETQRGREWHLTITKNGKYPSPTAVRLVRKDFNAEDFEQDDHSVKIASLWQPFNKDKRGDCEYKL